MSYEDKIGKIALRGQTKFRADPASMHLDPTAVAELPSPGKSPESVPWLAMRSTTRWASLPLMNYRLMNCSQATMISVVDFDNRAHRMGAERGIFL
jgi:hypothetical protein